MRRLLVQTCFVLHDRKWSKSWDAGIVYFYCTQQCKQPSFFIKKTPAKQKEALGVAR
jgi:hypothetical protein